jgi:hypothetical protein
MNLFEGRWRGDLDIKRLGALCYAVDTISRIAVAGVTGRFEITEIRKQ